MTQEEIIKKAQEVAGEIGCAAYYGGTNIDEDEMADIFFRGANWRINSVWHDADSDQEPEEGSLCLLEIESYDEDGERYIDYVSSQWGHFGWTDDFLNIIKRRSEGRYKIIRWAYIGDLLPIKEY